MLHDIRAVRSCFGRGGDRVKVGKSHLLGFLSDRLGPSMNPSLHHSCPFPLLLTRENLKGDLFVVLDRCVGDKHRR